MIAPSAELRRTDLDRAEVLIAEMRELCAVAPARIAGSEAHARALAWAEAKLAAVPGAKVWRQEMTIPNWRRGRPAEARLTTGSDQAPLALLALGFSGATPAEGLRAPVLEVRSLAEFEKLGRAQAEGKIVFFNRPMELDAAGRGSSYGGAVDQRSRGPALAARLGARAALVRSITNADDDLPHTGMTRFDAGQTPLPCAALGVRSAERLSRALRANPDASLQLFIDAHNGPAIPSANLVAEIRGRERPEEILLVGGHLDAWDVAPGAHDNATGVMQSIEVFRLLARAPGPRRTVRCVLFTAEEIGALGGAEYGRLAEAAKERHLLALETDAGGFAPTGFDFGAASDTAPLIARLERVWGPWLVALGVRRFTADHGGTDVRPLQRLGAVTATLRTDSVRYFLLHHAASDTPDRVDAAELYRGALALATVLQLADRDGLP